ncbi:LysR family transcriptional regulator [Hoeflea prorocentri]|uniref:LysR family transcriptional regulator n=1 Tax=Hoeflea prorocentri TaxID=1922333 RepID=A0A9X3UMY7_9HYPH|nr:LysR family transcriptional regulator [Hoeflea prorocentri]MCY6383516.1 LysR family transcriptional regulator [Hoeflea prorocentri]MDA5401316.1 LysR family transcriptional regulator [Hoeflea prorocentri]
MDWNLIRSFLAVADHGALGRAADDLGLSQPTLGRHIDALEASLGLTLFKRGRQGMALTEAGLSIVDDARAMSAEADRLSLKAAGRSQTVRGTVRITASKVVSTYVLPPILSALGREEPDIEIELVPSDTVENLLSRDADIAVRMIRPTQNDLIARKTNDVGMGTYADERYLARFKAPKTVEELFQHRLIGMDRSNLILEGMADLGIHAQRGSFAVRTDDQVAYFELVKAGAGIGFIAHILAAGSPGLQRILPDVTIPPLPIWLASHSELRTSRRIRRTMDFLYEHIRLLPLNET